MPSCPESLQQIVGFAGATKSLHDNTVLSACLQYEATFQAGVVQAHAAWFSGAMTILAGVMAVGAAVVGTVTAYRAVAEQIENTGELQRAQQVHDIKQKVYLGVNAALFEGLMTVAKLAQLSVPVDQALTSYNARASDVSLTHVVADTDTARSIMLAVRCLGRVHGELANKRLLRDLDQTSPSQQQALTFGRMCLPYLDQLKTPMIDAVMAMRAELGMIVDRAAYEAMLNEILKGVYADTEKSISEAEALFRRSAH